MEQVEQQSAVSKPLWRRIVDFPLVTMLIAIFLYAAALGLGIGIVSLIPKFGPYSLYLVVKNGIVVGLLILMYKIVIAKLGEHPKDDLPAAGSGKGFGAGFLLGAAIFSLVVGAAALDGVYHIVGKGSAAELVHDLVVTSLMPGFMEEIFFRGIIFRWLEELLGSWAAMILSALAFGFAHFGNPGAGVIACLWITFEAGILLAAAYMFTRNLWLAIGIHAAWNFTQGFIFDIDVSGTPEQGLVQAKLTGTALLTGGGFGLEASIFALVIGTIAGLVLLFAALKRGELMHPRWVWRRRLRAA